MVPVRGFDGNPILDKNGQPAMTFPTKINEELKCDNCGSVNIEVKAELSGEEKCILIFMCIFLLWPCVLCVMCSTKRKISNAYC